MRRGVVIAGVVALLGATLALMPFNDDDLRCGSPLFGADAVQPDQPANGRALIIVLGCVDEGAKRLVLASVLLVGGMVVTAVGLSLTSASDLGHKQATRAGPTT